MGLHGSIVLHPLGGRPPAPDRLHTVARQILQAFERLGLLLPNTSESIAPDQEPTFVTCDALEDDLATDLKWIHLAVDPDQLLHTVGELVYTMTEQEWSGSDSEEKGQALAFPFLDVTVLSEAIPAINNDGSVACRAWALIEFSYGSARYSEEVHRIRREDHPLFQELRTLMNTEVSWTVVVG